MHFDLADHYHPGESRLHRLSPRTKVAATLLVILGVALVPHRALWAYFPLWALVAGCAVAAGLSPWLVMKRSLVALPFALAAVTLPFTVEGRPLAQLPLLGLSVTQEGTLRFLSILSKSWLSVQAAVLLGMITPFAELLWGLRSLRLPSLLVSVIGMTYRYLFVLSDEALRLLRARRARSGVRPGYRAGGSLVWRGKVAGGLAGTLMLRSLERSERVYQAMLARGYRGEILNLSQPQQGPADGLALAAWVALLGLILFLAVRL